MQPLNFVLLFHYSAIPLNSMSSQLRFKKITVAQYGINMFDGSKKPNVGAGVSFGQICIPVVLGGSPEWLSGSWWIKNPVISFASFQCCCIPYVILKFTNGMVHTEFHPVFFNSTSTVKFMYFHAIKLVSQEENMKRDSHERTFHPVLYMWDSPSSSSGCTFPYHLWLLPKNRIVYKVGPQTPKR